MSKKSKSKRSSKPIPGKKPVGAKPIKRKTQNNNFQWWWVVAAVVVVAVVLGAIWVLQPKDAPAADAQGNQISVTEAYAKYETGVFLLDVREQDEWDEYHAPGTTLIPLGELADRVDELPRDQEIVVICRSGNRSQQGRDILLDAGFTNVSSMAGGLKEWRTAGYPVVSGP